MGQISSTIPSADFEVVNLSDFSFGPSSSVSSQLALGPQSSFVSASNGGATTPEALALSGGGPTLEGPIIDGLDFGAGELLNIGADFAGILIGIKLFEATFNLAFTGRTSR